MLIWTIGRVTEKEVSFRFIWPRDFSVEIAVYWHVLLCELASLMPELNDGFGPSERCTRTAVGVWD